MIWNAFMRPTTQAICKELKSITAIKPTGQAISGLIINQRIVTKKSVVSNQIKTYFENLLFDNVDLANISWAHILSPQHLAKFDNLTS